MNDDLKSISTVRDVARKVGLSPARFYQLVKGGVFPPPLYLVETRRPIYTDEQQRQCLEVRQRNCGVNGKPICFYARRIGAPALTARPRPAKSGAAPRQQVECPWLRESLQGLGLVATADAVAAALNSCFPKGVGATPESDIIRSVFLYLKRQDCSGSVG